MRDHSLALLEAAMRALQEGDEAGAARLVAGYFLRVPPRRKETDGVSGVSHLVQDLRALYEVGEGRQAPLLVRRFFGD